MKSMQAMAPVRPRGGSSCSVVLRSHHDSSAEPAVAAACSAHSAVAAATTALGCCRCYGGSHELHLGLGMHSRVKDVRSHHVTWVMKDKCKDDCETTGSEDGLKIWLGS